MNHCGGGNFKRLLKRADKVQAKVTLILGDEEIRNNTVTVKDMASATQETVSRDEAVAVVKRILNV